MSVPPVLRPRQPVLGMEQPIVDTDRLTRQLRQATDQIVAQIARGDSRTGVYAASILLNFVAEGGEHVFAEVRVVDLGHPANTPLESAP